MAVAASRESLPELERKKYDDAWQANAFNGYANDLMSLHRSLPDTRDLQYVRVLFINLVYTDNDSLCRGAEIKLNLKTFDNLKFNDFLLFLMAFDELLKSGVTMSGWLQRTCVVPVSFCYHLWRNIVVYIYTLYTIILLSIYTYIYNGGSLVFIRVTMDMKFADLAGTEMSTFTKWGL